MQRKLNVGENSTKASGCLREPQPDPATAAPKIQGKVMSQFLYLDQIQLELQQQQNALLSQEGREVEGTD